MNVSDLCNPCSLPPPPSQAIKRRPPLELKKLIEKCTLLCQELGQYQTWTEKEVMLDLVSDTAHEILEALISMQPKRRKSLAGQQCHSCHTFETPEWRRGPDGARTLCNACGLHGNHCHTPNQAKRGKDPPYRVLAFDHTNPSEMINQTGRNDLGAYKHTTKEEKKKIVPVFLCGGKTYLSTVPSTPPAQAYQGAARSRLDGGGVPNTKRSNVKKHKQDPRPTRKDTKDANDRPPAAFNVALKPACRATQHPAMIMSTMATSRPFNEGSGFEVSFGSIIVDA
ncbi:hypothetical protein [Absidia glauca]|uniref:GATA-type domain-containing protein n=1 Tax=Absidia glauca TaxID=4829 RepID=A0A163KUV0_ABSGL|nr:hypothetical protein [Absidia glauca]